MKQVKGGVTAAKGFEAASTAAGIKYKDRTDMALVYSQVPCVAAGTFTTNVVKAAPVKWDQQVVKSGAKAQAVVVNSGIANACTGAEGFGYCKDTADAAAKALNISADGVLIGSTGVIGKQIPIDKLTAGIKVLAGKKNDTLENGTEAAKAIMPKKQPFGAYMKGHYDLYLLLLPAVLYVAIFMYVPMYGVLMAFQDYSPARGIMGSTFVGLKHFEKFFSTYMAKQIITNTVVLSAYSLIVSFPFPVILALMLNYCVSKRFGKVVQTVTYMPYFISVMVLVGMMNIFFSTNYGVVNMVLKALGMEAYTFMSSEASFRHMYVWSGIWQGMGYSSVIYFAALAGIDPTLYEAAELDGASKLQRILYIDLPSIMPTVIIMLIMSAGNLMSVGFEKAYLMQNDRNSGVSEILSTYVYKVGLIDARYSFSAAINLFNSAINFVILITINKISGKLSETSLW